MESERQSRADARTSRGEHRLTSLLYTCLEGRMGDDVGKLEGQSRCRLGRRRSGHDYS